MDSYPNGRTPQWASLETDIGPEDTELSPIYDFNSRRDRWRDWRTYSGQKQLRWAHYVFTGILFLLALVFFSLYVSERGSNDLPGPTPPQGTYLYSEKETQDPFANYQLDVDFRGVQREQSASLGMVTSDHGDCSDMGGEILRIGGNAMDAAVTTALCMGIVHPFASGTGGGTFILVHLSNGTSAVIDAREVAPLASNNETFAGHALSQKFLRLRRRVALGHAALEMETGGLSIAVPLELKGLEMLADHYGNLEWADLVQPVIPLARNGFAASPKLVDSLIRVFEDRQEFVMRDLWETFLILDDNLWRFPEVGEICCKRPALARTLELMAKKGVQSVYASEWGDDLVADIQNFLPFGIVEKEDLIRAQPTLKEPVRSKLFGLDVVTVPPPSSGATLLMALQLLETFSDVDNVTLNYHRMAEAMKHMFAVRTHLGDPGPNNTFLDLKKLLADIQKPNFILNLKRISNDTWVQPISKYGGKYHAENDPLKDGGTSHICTADAKGNVVSMTSSINKPFGSTVISKKTGLLLNDHMADFYQSGLVDEDLISLNAAANMIEPGKKPLSSMSPLIFLEDGELHLAIGGSGGRQIITSLLQVLYNHLGAGMELSEAIREPRIADFLTSDLRTENVKRGPVTISFPPSRAKALKRLGQSVKVGLEGECNINAIVKRQGMFRGIPDPRKDGAAARNLS